MTTKQFILIEFNEDTLVVGLHPLLTPATYGALTFTDRDELPPGFMAARQQDRGEDDQSNAWKLLKFFGWEYIPLPRWQHDLIVAAMRCQKEHDDFTNKDRSLGDWFRAAIDQADLLPPQLTRLAFSAGPGCVFDGAKGQAYNDMLVCRLANRYGWLPEDGTLYHEFTEDSAAGYVEEALAYLNANCCAPDIYLEWVEGDLMVLTKQEEELPF